MRFPPEPLTRAEALALVDAPNPRWPTGARNRALLALMYRSGLRVAEALALRPWDVDAESSTVRVLNGKGKKTRTVGMDARAFELVAEWLERRACLPTTDTSPLFCTLQGGAVYTSYVRAMIKRMAKRAGVRRRAHPHGLRHTMAAEMREEGVDVGVISKQLGHSSIATTARYLDHIAPAVVVKAMAGRDW